MVGSFKEGGKGKRGGGAGRFPLIMFISSLYYPGKLLLILSYYYASVTRFDYFCYCANTYHMYLYVFLRIRVIIDGMLCCQSLMFKEHNYVDAITQLIRKLSYRGM